MHHVQMKYVRSPKPDLGGPYVEVIIDRTTSSEKVVGKATTIRGLRRILTRLSQERFLSCRVVAYGDVFILTPAEAVPKFRQFCCEAASRKTYLREGVTIERRRIDTQGRIVLECRLC